MKTIQNNTNEIGFVSCPHCGKDIRLPFNILNFYLSLSKVKNVPGITLNRVFTLNQTNKNNINVFCKDTLGHKPFISYIIITRAYRNAFNEMARLGLLEQETIDEYLKKNIDLILF